MSIVLFPEVELTSLQKGDYRQKGQTPSTQVHASFQKPSEEVESEIGDASGKSLPSIGSDAGFNFWINESGIESVLELGKKYRVELIPLD